MARIDFKAKAIPKALANSIAGTSTIEGAKVMDWWKRQGTDLQRKFADSVALSMRNGETLMQATTRITGGTLNGVKVPAVMATTRPRAAALVATAMNNATNKARMETYRANSDTIKAVQQVSTLDNRTSDVCIAYAGLAWSLPDMKPIKHKLAFNGGPPRHFNCRSSLVPITKSFREMGIDLDEAKPGTRASMDGEVPADITFDAWLKGKGTNFQNGLLGPKRAQLWRDGKITLQDLVNKQGDPLSVDELEALVAKRRDDTARVKAVRAAKKPAPKAPDTAYVHTWVKDGEHKTVVDWHQRFWPAADDNLKKAIRTMPPMGGAVKKSKAGSYYNPASKQISMRGNLHKGGDAEASAAHIWRHEYGHYMDDVMYAEAVRNEPSVVAYAKALVSSDKALGKTTTYDDALEQAVRVHQMKARGYRRGSTFSYSLDTQLKADSAQLIEDAAKNNGVSRVDTLRQLQPADRDARFKLIFEGVGSTVDEAREFLVALNSSLGTDAYELHEAMLHLAASVNTGSLIPFVQLTKSSLWYGNIRRNAMISNFQDYVGSITKNRVGRGHDTAYYNQSPDMQHTEAFANAVAMLGHHPFWGKLLNRTLPEFWTGVKNAIDDVAKRYKP